MENTQTAQKSFVDSTLARIIALLIAIGIGVLLFTNWGDEIKQVFSGTPTASELPNSVTAPSETAAINPALAECLEKRIGDVDQMKEDGVLSDAQYASFRERAESLCRQSNPE